MSSRRTSSRCLVLTLVVAGFLGTATVWAADDAAASVKSQQKQAAGDAHQTYFLFERAKEEKPPKAGFGLLLILPGGDGSAEFKPFVSNIYAAAVPPGFLAAELVAVQWTPQQEIVWPTAKSPVPGEKFTTEQFITSVVADVNKQHPLDNRRIFTLTWSSSGPAGYAASLAPKSPVTGSFVAMSVFNAKQLPPLSAARGRAYYIFHSPEDQTCPMWMARWADKALKQAGAQAQLVEYSGGHGWSSGAPIVDITKGLAWLIEASDRAPVTTRPASGPAKAATPPSRDKMKSAQESVTPKP